MLLYNKIIILSSSILFAGNVSDNVGLRFNGASDCVDNNSHMDRDHISHGVLRVDSQNIRNIRRSEECMSNSHDMCGLSDRQYKALRDIVGDERIPQCELCSGKLYELAVMRVPTKVIAKVGPFALSIMSGCDECYKAQFRTCKRNLRLLNIFC